MIYKITVQELGGAWTLTLGTLDLGLWLLESMEQDFVDGTARDCGDGGGVGGRARGMDWSLVEEESVSSGWRR